MSCLEYHQPCLAQKVGCMLWASQPQVPVIGPRVVLAAAPATAAQRTGQPLTRGRLGGDNAIYLPRALWDLRKCASSAGSCSFGVVWRRTLERSSESSLFGPGPLFLPGEAWGFAKNGLAAKNEAMFLCTCDCAKEPGTEAFSAPGASLENHLAC